MFRFLHYQLTEGIQSGLPGLRVVSHVVRELNSVIDHAPIHRLQTTEHHAKDLHKRNRCVPPKCVPDQVNDFRFSPMHKSNLLQLSCQSVNGRIARRYYVFIRIKRRFQCF